MKRAISRRASSAVKLVDDNFGTRAHLSDTPSDIHYLENLAHQSVSTEFLFSCCLKQPSFEYDSVIAKLSVFVENS